MISTRRPKGRALGRGLRSLLVFGATARRQMAAFRDPTRLGGLASEAPSWTRESMPELDRLRRPLSASVALEAIERPGRPSSVERPATGRRRVSRPGAEEAEAFGRIMPSDAKPSPDGGKVSTRAFKPDRWSENSPAGSRDARSLGSTGPDLPSVAEILSSVDGSTRPRGPARDTIQWPKPARRRLAADVGPTDRPISASRSVERLDGAEAQVGGEAQAKVPAMTSPRRRGSARGPSFDAAQRAVLTEILGRFDPASWRPRHDDVPSTSPSSPPSPSPKTASVLSHPRSRPSIVEAPPTPSADRNEKPLGVDPDLRKAGSRAAVGGLRGLVALADRLEVEASPEPAPRDEAATLATRWQTGTREMSRPSGPLAEAREEKQLARRLERLLRREARRHGIDLETEP